MNIRLHRDFLEFSGSRWKLLPSQLSLSAEVEDMFRLVAVVLILSTAAALGVPQLQGADNGYNVQQAKNLTALDENVLKTGIVNNTEQSLEIQPVTSHPRERKDTTSMHSDDASNSQDRSFTIEITTDNGQDPSPHQHGDLPIVVQPNNSSNVEVEQTTQKTLAVTSQKQEDLTDVAFIPTISSTNLSTLMEISTKGDLNSSLKLENISEVYQPASSLLVQMVKSSEKKQDNSSHKQKKFQVKLLTYPSVSKVEQTTENTSFVTSQNQESHSDVAFIPTISSTNLSTLMEISTKGDLNSSLELKDISNPHQSPSSIHIKMLILPEKKQNNTSHKRKEVNVKQYTFPSGSKIEITTDMKEEHSSHKDGKRPIKVQSSHKDGKRPIKVHSSNGSNAEVKQTTERTPPQEPEDHTVVTHSVNISSSTLNNQAEHTTQRNLFVTSQIQEVHTDVTFNPNMSSTNLSSLMEQTTERNLAVTSPKQQDQTTVANTGDISSAQVEVGLEKAQNESSPKHEFLPYSDSSPAVQVEQTTQGHLASTSHIQEHHIDVADNLNISSGNLTTQVELEVENAQNKSSQTQEVLPYTNHSASSSTVQVEQTTELILAITSQTQEDHADVALSLNNSSADLNKQMELATEEDKDVLHHSLEDSSVVPNNTTSSGNNLTTQMEPTIEEDKDVLHHSLEDSSVVPNNTTSSGNNLTTQMELATKGDKDSLEDSSVEPNNTTSSGNNLTTQVELGVEQEQNKSSLENMELATKEDKDSLEDSSVVPDNTTSSGNNLTTQVELEVEKEQNKSSLEHMELATKEDKDSLEDSSVVPDNTTSSGNNLTTQVELGVEKEQNKSSLEHMELATKEDKDSLEDSSVVPNNTTSSGNNLTTQMELTTKEDKDSLEDSSVVPDNTTSSGNNLTTQVELEVEKEQNKSSLEHMELATKEDKDSLEDSSVVPDNTTSSGNNLTTQLDLTNNDTQSNSSHKLEVSPVEANNLNISTSNLNAQLDLTNNDTQSNSSHKLEVSPVEANNLNISTSNLNAQVEQGVEEEHQETNSSDLETSASNSIVEMMAANWELNSISGQLKDFFTMVYNLTFAANEQVNQTTTPNQNKTLKREILSDEPVSKNLNTSASNLETQVDLEIQNEQENSSDTEEYFSDEPENMNISVSALNTEVEVAVENKQDNSSQKQVDHSASSSNIQTEVADDEEQDDLPYEQDDPSDMPYNLSTSASNSNVQMAQEDEILSLEQDPFVMPDNLSYSASDENTAYAVLPNTVAPQENLYNREDSKHDDHQLQKLQVKKLLTKHLSVTMREYNKNQGQSFQMKPLKQDKSHQQEDFDGVPLNIDSSASNLNLQVLQPTNGEKDNSQQQENFYDMPFDLDQAASNMNEQVLDPTHAEDHYYKEHYFFELPTDLEQTASDTKFREPFQQQEEDVELEDIEDINEYAFRLLPSSHKGNAVARFHDDEGPHDMDQSASNLKTRAKIHEIEDVDEEPFNLDESASDENFTTDALMIYEDEDSTEEPFYLNQSASNVNFTTDAMIYEDEDSTEEPFHLNQSASNANFTMGAMIHEDKDSNEEPLHLNQSASNVNLEVLADAQEDKDLDEEVLGLNQSAYNINYTQAEINENKDVTEKPIHLDQSASNISIQIPAVLQEDKDLDEEVLSLNQSASNVNVTRAKINEDKHVTKEPFQLDQSASNINLEVPADVQEEVLGLNQSASNVNMDLPDEDDDYTDLTENPIDLVPTAKNITMELPVDENRYPNLTIHVELTTKNTTMELPVDENPDLTENTNDLEFTTRNITIRPPTEEKEDEVLHTKHTAMEHSTSNVIIQPPTEEKEDEVLHTKHVAMEHSTSNVIVEPTTEAKRERSHKAKEISYRRRFPNYLHAQVEPTTEVKTERSHKSQEISYRGRFADYKPDHVEPTTEVKTERSHKSQEISYRGHFADYKPVHVAPTTEVKPERSHKSQEISYRGRFAIYTPVHVEPTTEVKTERSHKSQEISYRGRFAIYTPVHVESTTEVKRERSHKSQENFYSRRFPHYLHTQVETTTEVKRDRSHEAEDISYRGRFGNKVYVQVEPTTEAKREWSHKAKALYYRDRSANNEHVQMEKLTNVNQEDSLKEDGIYDVPVYQDQVADSVKVQYLVMSFNETGQEDLVRSVKGQEKHTPHQKQSTISNKIQPSNISCPAEFAVLPDPNGDCSSYFMCHNGTLESRRCSKDLHFNPISKVCDYKRTALCDLKCHEEENDRHHVPGYCNMYFDCVKGVGNFIRCREGLHYNAITKQCDSPTKASCEITCTNYSTLMALPGRCNMYGNCNEGIATYHLCPPTLHFNPVSLKCDIPESEDCKIRCLSADGYFPVLGQCMNYIECQNNHGRVISCPSGLHFNFLLQTCDIPSKAGCEMKCKEPNGYFPFPGVCSYYLMCLDGTPFLKKCPGDLEFNEDTKQCDIVTKDHCLPYCPMENGIFPVNNHCDLYMRCTNGQPLVKRCPRGLHFNSLFKHCDLPENAKCIFPCPYPSGLFPMPGKCNKFLRCEGGEATVLTCAQGLHFNARTRTCDWPPSAQCEISCPESEGYYPVQGACNAYVVCSEGRPTLKKCPYGKHFNLEAKRCDLPEYANCEFVCPGNDGLYSYRGHCDSYYHCENGTPHIDSCPPGLLFSVETNMCDLPENVHCYNQLQ